MYCGGNSTERISVCRGVVLEMQSWLSARWRNLHSDAGSCERLRSRVQLRRGWRCNRGYRVVGETCLKVETPAHAYRSIPAMAPDGNVSEVTASPRACAHPSTFLQTLISFTGAMNGSANAVLAAPTTAALQSSFPRTRTSTILAMNGGASAAFAKTCRVAWLWLFRPTGSSITPEMTGRARQAFARKRARASPHVNADHRPGRAEPVRRTRELRK